MRAIVTAVLTIAAASAAPAQTLPNPGTASLSRGQLASGYQQSNTFGAPFVPGRWSATPTTRRQQIDWAIALREEAVRLQAEDGGTLSDRHARHIQRRAARLLRP